MPPDILHGPNDFFPYPLPVLRGPAVKQIFNDEISQLRREVDSIAIAAGVEIARSYHALNAYTKFDEDHPGYALALSQSTLVYAALQRSQAYSNKRLVRFDNLQSEGDSDVQSSAALAPNSSFLTFCRGYKHSNLSGQDRVMAVWNMIEVNDPLLQYMMDENCGLIGTSQDAFAARVGCYGMLGVLTEFAWANSAIGAEAP